jgi:putative transposase
VDLNPIRAGRAKTPEESEFTSIRARILDWQKEQMGAGADSEGDTRGRDRVEDEDLGACWLCPISSGTDRRRILSMTTAEYIDLVDKSGRMMRADKRGAIEADLAPILVRIGAKPERWMETVSGFGDQFSLVAGLVLNLRNYAEHFGRRWFRGIAASRAAFVLPGTQRA